MEVMKADAFYLQASTAISQMELGFANGNVEAVIEKRTRELVLTIQAKLASGMETVLETKHILIPADWWQHLRARWFPTWWIRMYPLKTETVIVSMTTTSYHLCPHLKFEGKHYHMQWVAKSQDELRERMKKDNLSFFLRRFLKDSDPLHHQVSPIVINEIEKILSP